MDENHCHYVDKYSADFTDADDDYAVSGYALKIMVQCISMRTHNLITTSIQLTISYRRIRMGECF